MNKNLLGILLMTLGMFSLSINDIIYKNFYNIGVAVGTDQGLVVPVLRNADQKSVVEIEKEIWSQWSKSGSQNLDFLLGQGRLYMQSGRFDDAIDVFSQIIKKDPQFAEAWNARATTFYMKGDFKNSISDIDQVLLLNADHFGALSGLGSMLEKLEHLDAALDAFKRAEEINPLNLNIKNSILRLLKKVEGISL